MRFYTPQHPLYCGIDLHARSMYVCILDQRGEVRMPRNRKTDPDAFLKTVAPYREGLVVAESAGVVFEALIREHGCDLRPVLLDFLRISCSLSGFAPKIQSVH